MWEWKIHQNTQSFGNNLSYTVDENLFIIDSTPREDVTDNRFGLNGEKKRRKHLKSSPATICYRQPITFLATTLQCRLVVTSGTRFQLSKRFIDVFVTPSQTISLGVGSIMNNIYICTYDNFAPHFPVSFGLTFMKLEPEVIISSLHQAIRLRKMQETDLLTKATCRPEVGTYADWMRSRVMAMSYLTVSLYRGCLSAFSPRYSFFTYY